MVLRLRVYEWVDAEDLEGRIEKRKSLYYGTGGGNVSMDLIETEKQKCHESARRAPGDVCAAFAGAYNLVAQCLLFQLAFAPC